MSDGVLHSFWSSLQRAEQRLEAEARDAERSLYRTLYGYESRVMRLRWALEASGPLARKEIAGKLKSVSLDAIWHILISIVKDIALYYGGSVVLGTAVGAGLGSLVFGAGAIPGAALGFEAGMVLGEWVMMFLGLKMIAEGMIDTIPPAMSCYADGFRAAWGPAASDRPNASYLAGYAPSKETAAQRFAHGHVLMIMAILIAMVAYLTRGKSKEALFKAVGDSKRLGSKVADWLKENEEKLLKEESLQPKVRPRPESPQETSQAKTEQAKPQRRPSKPEVSNVPKAVSSVPSSSGPQVVEGAGSSVDMMGHKIYDPGFSPLSTNPSAQYRFSDPTYRQTGGDVYFGENLATSYYEVRQNVAGKSLFVGDVHVDNILDLTDEKVLDQMNIDSTKLLSRVDSPLDQKAVYGYTNQIANQAFDAGYNGILYPSTRGPGNAVVLFGGRYDPNLIAPVVDFPLQ